MNLSLTSLAPTILAASDGIPDNVLPLAIGGMILGFCGLGIAYVAIITEARTKREQQETIRVALEKGVPVPSLAIDPESQPKPPNADRRTGIILLAVSVGVFVFFSMMGLGPLAYAAAVPGCIGVAYLLIWALDRGRGETRSGGESRL